MNEKINKIRERERERGIISFCDVNKNINISHDQVYLTGNA
jgi:hypothetical protein